MKDVNFVSVLPNLFIELIPIFPRQILQSCVYFANQMLTTALMQIYCANQMISFFKKCDTGTNYINYDGDQN